jgi:hypothetical protein
MRGTKCRRNAKMARSPSGRERKKYDGTQKALAEREQMPDMRQATDGRQIQKLYRVQGEMAQPQSRQAHDQLSPWQKRHMLAVQQATGKGWVSPLPGLLQGKDRALQHSQRQQEQPRPHLEEIL